MKFMLLILSSAQLAKAFKHNNIKYFKTDETNSMFAHQSADLITVSQTVQWFDMTKFEKECVHAYLNLMEL